MKSRIVVALAASALVIGFLIWDFDFVSNESFEVREIGDEQEIYFPKYPEASIPSDVIFYLQDGQNLIAISSDLSKQKGTDLRGREKTCAIFVTNSENGEHYQFVSEVQFTRHYSGSVQQAAKVLEEYERRNC